MGGGCGAIFVHRNGTACGGGVQHVLSTCMRWCAARAWQPWPAAGDGWNVSIMVAEELPHLIQPVAEALTADTSLVSKRTRQSVCVRDEWFKVAMVPAQFG